MQHVNIQFLQANALSSIKMLKSAERVLRSFLFVRRDVICLERTKQSVRKVCTF